MASSKVRLDSNGIGAILAGGAVTAMVNGAGHKVAGNVRAEAHDGPVPVDVTPYRANLRGRPRAAVAVTMTHPGAIGIEAKHGTLVRAASAAGIPVKAR